MNDKEFRADEHTGVTENRRAYPRTTFSGPVLVDTQKTWHKLRAIDVSAGGIRLEGEIPLPVGAEVELYFELNHLSVETSAKVVRRDQGECALAFEREGHGPLGHRPKIASLRPRAA